jgi:hypothetical protein
MDRVIRRGANEGQIGRGPQVRKAIPYPKAGAASLSRQPITNREVRSIVRSLRNDLIGSDALFLPHHAATIRVSRGSSRIDLLDCTVQVTRGDFDGWAPAHFGLSEPPMQLGSEF